MKESNLPTWRIEQVQRLALSSAHTSFAHLIRHEMKGRGWKYDPGNNEFQKGEIRLYFVNGIGVFSRSGCDGRLSKINHQFKILPITG